MEILILNGSPRADGGTKAMVDAFATAAEEAGHDVAVFDVANLSIAGCRACEWCHTQGDGRCVIRDDMDPIYEAWDEADMIVLASPVYYGSFSGQLHCALHRTYAPGIPERATKTALFLCSGSPGVYEASERIYHGFVQGYFGTEDCGIFAATTAEAKSEAMAERLRELARSL